MKQITLAILAISCSPALTTLDDATCAAGGIVEKAGDPLSFGRYAPTSARSSAELLFGIECAAKRWRAATCLDVDTSLAAESWVRWKSALLMPDNATGHASGPFNDARIFVSTEADEPAVCPVLVHELGHVLRRDYTHPGPDGSMSFPSVHVNSEPVSRITQDDIDWVCDFWDCGCELPE